MRFFYLFIGTLFLTACANKSDGFVIDVHIEGLPEGTQVFLNKFDGLNPALIDSVEVQNGRFRFEGVATDTTLAVISFEDQKTPIFFFLENAHLKVAGHADSIYKAQISGSKTNEAYVQVRDHISQLNQEANETFLQSRNISPDDSLKIKALSNQFEALQEEIKSYSLTYTKQHTDSYVSLFLLFDLFDALEDERMQELSGIFYSLHPSIQESSLGKGFLNQLNRLNALAIGGTAPDFIAPTPDGDAFKLSNLTAEYIILDFWASWCTPCRAENPRLVRLYEEFHNRGLDIVSVAMDNSRDLWRKAIQKDGIGAWHHVSNLMYWEEPIAKDYGVLAIPKTFILNRDFEILATDLRGKELETFIRNKFSKTD